MKDIKHYEDIIKEKRKKTPFRDFVKEICSWSPLNLYKYNWKICRYPDTWRIKNINTKEAQNAWSYSLEYDFNISFFDNFKKLMDIVPLQRIMDFWSNENADFVDQAFWVKNWYLVFVSWFWVENIMYSAYCYENLINIFNSLLITHNCSNIYFCSNIDNSYNIFYSKYINDSSEIWFSTNLIWCHECIFCDKLENQRYCFQNKILEKEEYFKIKKQILEKKEKFLGNYKFISKNKAINRLSENVNWINNIRCKNVENGYFINNANDSRNVINVWWDNIRNFYDCFDAWVNSDNFYWVVWAWDSCKNIFCSTQIAMSSNIYYSYLISNCSFCIWCIWLKNKSFCILNKQYSKEEWYIKTNELFKKMEESWILWNFFPWKLNPFYFNDTAAYLIDDGFTKEELKKNWYLWRDEKIKVDVPENAKVINSVNVGNENIRSLQDFEWYDKNWKWHINPEVLKKIIKDEKWNYYKIVQMEYDFLMKYELPLPELHWLDRIKFNFNF